MFFDFISLQENVQFNCMWFSSCPCDTYAMHCRCGNMLKIYNKAIDSPRPRAAGNRTALAGSNCRPISILALIMTVVLGWTAAAGAQDLKAMQNLNQVVRSGLLQFRIVTGRVSLNASRVSPIQTPNNFEKQDVLSIQSDYNGDIVMSYNWSNSNRQLSIEVSNVSKVRIRYSGKDDDTQVPVEFYQPLQAKTVLKVGPEGKQQIYSAPNLWHLFLAYPAETKRHLVPLLELLHPNWKLSESAATLESELLRKAGNKEISDRKRWVALVEQLGDESFAKRQAADRAIRAADPAVLSFLQQLDFSRLDAEQQFRVRRIIETLTERLGDDSPEQVASWLAGDASVWLILLNRSEVATRRQAARQLVAMLGGPIPVDPEADPASQKAQMEQLRLRIESPATEDK